MKRYFVAALFLLAMLLLPVACQTSQTNVVTREIITNIAVNMTATPQPTEESKFLGGGGEYIAFTTESEDDHFGVFLVNPISKERISLTTVKINSHPRFAAGSPQWSPDGTKIAFIAQDGAGKNIFIIDLATEEISSVLKTPTNITAFDWSPTGDQFAFLASLQATSDGSLYKVDLDGSNLEDIATRDDFRVEIAPVVEWPEDKQLLVSAHVFGEGDSFLRTVQLFRVSAEGGDLKRISDERFDYIWGDLSPDSSRIFFLSQDPNNEFDLFLMNSDRVNFQLLTDLSVARPAWSPDSTHIAYAYAGSISTMNVNDGTAVAIVTMYDTRAPSWSPDGEWIVFAGKSEENSYFQLYMVRSDGTELTLLTNTEQHHDLPVWQP